MHVRSAKQGICNIIHSRICSINNKGQERDRHNGFEINIGSIVVKEAENTAASQELVIEKVKGAGWQCGSSIRNTQEGKHKHNLNLIFNGALKTEGVSRHHGLTIDMIQIV